MALDRSQAAAHRSVARRTSRGRSRTRRRVYHSDALYSAVTHAMSALGWLEEWLDATARAADARRPLQFAVSVHRRTRLITPPRLMAAVGAGSLRQGAKLVPLEVARGA